MKKNDGSFEAKLGQLEEIVAALERDDVPLEEAIALYEKGMGLQRACEKILAEAKLRIEKLTAAEVAAPVAGKEKEKPRDQDQAPKLFGDGD